MTLFSMKEDIWRGELLECRWDLDESEKNKLIGVSHSTTGFAWVY